MITFEQICRRDGYDPKEIRKILKGKYIVRLRPRLKGGNKKAKRLQMLAEYLLAKEFTEEFMRIGEK